MENASPLKALLIAEGSGGHLIPALQLARALAASGAQVKLWYDQRPSMTQFTHALAEEAHIAAVDVEPLPTRTTAQTPFHRLWRFGQLWERSQRCFDTFAPDVVVGFGGWVSVPVVLAAKLRRLACLLHEQNAVPGRANRLLSRWVDRVAVSFPETQTALGGAATTILTGMPVRPSIGAASRGQTAARFGFSSDRPTILVLGGSQGARAINCLMAHAAGLLSPQERKTWQVLHVTGPADAAMVRQAYADAGLRAWVAPFLAEMEAAFAQADVVIARSGSSTIAELARCGIPAVLIPYPYAGGHQRINARIVEAVGGGMVIGEHGATPRQLLDAVRHLLHDARLRQMMGSQLRSLHVADATERLHREVVALARRRTEDHPRDGGEN
jgi:UDP-N-acetylglucosamine--N-acetylmuramyl-(pentapeptide) pyrophosphoryl-undecaprenol N-acetylglucosamine transferase